MPDDNRGYGVRRAGGPPHAYHYPVEEPSEEKWKSLEWSPEFLKAYFDTFEYKPPLPQLQPAPPPQLLQPQPIQLPPKLSLLPPFDLKLPPRSTDPGVGWVYFIQVNTVERAVKIGFTCDIEARLRALRVGVYAELMVVAYVRGTRADEKKYHAMFASQRLSGEWFKINEELFDLMYRLRADCVQDYG